MNRCRIIICLSLITGLLLCPTPSFAVSNLKATSYQKKIISTDIGKAVKKHRNTVNFKKINHAFPVTWCGYSAGMPVSMKNKCNDSLFEAYNTVPFSESWKIRPSAPITYKATTDRKNRFTLKSRVHYLNLKYAYRFSKKKTEKYDRIFRRKYIAARKKCKGKTKTQTIKKTYDYISKTVRYTVNTSESRNVYGCFVLKKGCCEGFNYGFRMILESYGIKTRNTVSHGHMWTQVLIGGKWKNFDLASASENKSCRYLFFNRTDSQLQKTGKEENTKIYNYPYAHPERNFARGF